MFCVRKIRRRRRTLGSGSAQAEPTACNASRVQSIEKNRDEDQRALHELHEEGVYVQEREAVVDHADEKHPDERAPKTALAPEETRSADDNGRNDAKFDAGAARRGRGPNASNR